ncbi:hypothetical protein PSR62_19255 [Rhodopirellula sp. P2]|nr:hypothetical protein [Rhodopirellula sp. P2]WDQ15761.1 hypothetical protein PSR62_19255 [Rhodopirellula sp. P2]
MSTNTSTPNDPNDKVRAKSAASGAGLTRADIEDVVSDAATPIDLRLQEIVSLLNEFEGRLTTRLDEFDLPPRTSSERAELSLEAETPDEPDELTFAEEPEDTETHAHSPEIAYHDYSAYDENPAYEEETTYAEDPSFAEAAASEDPAPAAPAYDEQSECPELEPELTAEPVAGSWQPPMAEEAPTDYVDLVSPEVHRLEEELQSERMRSHELQTQNEELAAQLASSGVTRTVSDTQGCDDSMSWEERKAKILEQMENDDFNEESFLESLSQSSQDIAASIDPDWIHNPVAFIDDLVDRLAQAEQTIAERNAEIHELQILLQNRADTRNDNVAFGAAAIAGMVDSDELVMAERARLAELKTEWEDKFRTAEIEVSLERAKLSRERQTLARRAEELEEQIEQLQREKRDARDYPKAGRRWLAELGLQSEGE